MNVEVAFDYTFFARSLAMYRYNFTDLRCVNLASGRCLHDFSLTMQR